MDKLLQTFLDLADIGEVYPDENLVLSYIKQRLRAANVSYKQDAFGNIIAKIPGETASPVLAFAGHVDIAAELNDRKVVVDKDKVITDGRGLLGGDDKTAVAAMLELADETRGRRPSRGIELIFTRGEESGGLGAIALDKSLLTASQVLVFDWMGAVNRVITRSPAYYKIDIEYLGLDAHPAEWQHGKNAGSALMKAAAGLTQGEYSSGVTFNIGIVSIGNARNKVPGTASIKAEIRSFDRPKIEHAADEIERRFSQVAKENDIKAKITIEKDLAAYELDEKSELFRNVKSALSSMELEVQLDETYGCFDGNVLAGYGLDVVIMGASFYNPHAVDEYVNIKEFQDLFSFMRATTFGITEQ